MTGVLPYYALKQRRQEVGFEGPDIEVKKRQDICRRARGYTKENIERLDSGLYLVPSSSTVAKFYEVEIDSFTCTCLDFPLISYCKHLCAVQLLFDEDGPPSDAPRSPNVPSLATLQDSGTEAAAMLPDTVIPKTPTLTMYAEKLERLAARLRRTRRKQTFTSLDDLATALDAMLLETDDSNVLPASQHVKPGSSSFKQTLEAMMPGIKTKRKPAGDPAYGAGASSGSKAKSTKPSRRKYVFYYALDSSDVTNCQRPYRANLSLSQSAIPSVPPHTPYPQLPLPAQPPPCLPTQSAPWPLSLPTQLASAWPLPTSLVTNT